MAEDLQVADIKRYYDDIPSLAVLSEKELRFVIGYIECGVKRMAAYNAGYGQECVDKFAAANLAAWKLFNDPRIALAIADMQSFRRAERAHLQEILLNSLIEDAFLDTSEAFDDTGKPLPLPAMPLHLRQRIKSWRQGAKGQVTVEFIDRQKAKDQLLSILGVGNQQQGLTININVGDNAHAALTDVENETVKRVGQIGINL